MAERSLRAGEERQFRRAVGAYFAYQTFSAANFFWPIFFVFYQRYGRLDLGTILELQAFSTLARVVLEIPLGLLADRFGRRPALVLGAALMGTGCAVIVADPSLVSFYVGELCFAAATAAKSGADSAFLFDCLAGFGRTDDYPRVEGRAQSLGALVGAASAVASGFLLEWWLPLPYLLTLGAAGATLAAATLLDEPRHRSVGPAPAGIARGAVAEIRSQPATLWLIALYALLVVASHVVFYLQQPYLETIGVPVVLFGVVFAAAKLVHAVVAQFAGRIEAWVSVGRMPAFLVAAAVAPIGLMGVVVHPLGALVPPLRGVADGLLQPLVAFYLNRLVSPQRRASVLSIASFVARALQAAALWAFGMALVQMSALAALRVAAVVGAIVGVLLLLRPRLTGGPPTRGRSTLDGQGRAARRLRDGRH
jgi:Major Facilitator Superfamily